MGDRAEKANKGQFQRCLILLLIDVYSGVFKEKSIICVCLLKVYTFKIFIVCKFYLWRTKLQNIEF